MSARCIILGAGGHARVVIDVLLAQKEFSIHGILDPNTDLWGKSVMGVSILGGDDLLASLAQSGVTAFIVGVGSVKSDVLRQNLFEMGVKFGLTPIKAVHPSAVLSNWAAIGEGTLVSPGAIINADAEIGCNAIINTGAIIEHGCRIGNDVHVATGARLAGDVHLGDRVFIGAGAIVKQGVTIGENTTVGAGAVVTKDVLPHCVVVGNPARKMDIGQ